MKKIILYFVTLSFIFLLSSCSEDDKPADPRDLFVKSNKSSLKVNDAKAKIKFRFKSSKEDYNTILELTLKRDSKSKTGFKVIFKTDEGHGLFDGEKYYFQDDKKKKFYINGNDLAPEMFITQNWIINPISMIMLNEDYTEKIKARKDSIRYIGTEKINGFETRYVESIIPVPKNKSVTVTTTFFDKVTDLPVKEIKKQVVGSESAEQTIEFTELSINNGVDDNIFAMTAPTDYLTELITKDSEPESTIKNTEAPDFTLKDLDGKDVTLSKLKGKVVILDFWGTWCKWCVKAMPKLQTVHENFKGKNVVVLGVSCQERPTADPKAFMAENKVTYNSLVNGDDVAAKYGVAGFPTLFVIGKDGKVITTKSGFSETMDKELIELIQKNL